MTKVVIVTNKMKSLKVYTLLTRFYNELKFELDTNRIACFYVEMTISECT
jgi:hypothetical protein